MQHHRPDETAEPTLSRRLGTSDADARAAVSEEIHIRNFDTSHSSTLTLRVRDDSDLVFAKRYQLEPGTTESVCDELPDGEYVVIVELDGHRRERARCRIGRSPDETALVEVGNGTVSLTQGLYS